MMPIIQVGPASIQSLVLALLIAIWLGASITERQAKRRGIRSDDVWNIMLIGIAATILFGRIVFILQNSMIYASQPFDMFSLTASALSLDYGIAGGAIAAYTYVVWRNISFARFADALAPGALIALAIITIGQLLNGDAIGTPTDLPWAISLWGDLRHPVQIYLAMITLIGAIVVWQLARRPLHDGSIALFAIAWYSAARVFIDGFRGDETLLGGGYRLSQMVAFIVLLMALWAMSRLEGKPEPRFLVGSAKNNADSVEKSGFSND
ncbi:MAG: prolipoprotein diacylglyceryl transferase [Chloroflexi bacterium]|nr:prolipoprotein diacylglyceryl transferase [Chloroflexota bacterium]